MSRRRYSYWASPRFRPTGRQFTMNEVLYTPTSNSAIQPPSGQLLWMTFEMPCDDDDAP